MSWHQIVQPISRSQTLRMTRLQFALLLLAATCVSFATPSRAKRVRYDNYHVYQLNAVNSEQLAIIKQLEAASSKEYIFLDGVHIMGAKINVIVAPQRVADFVKTLRKAGIAYELLEKNAQSQLENDKVADPNRRSGEYTWDVYHELNDTYNWLHRLAAQYPNQVSVIVAGKSYEGREMLGIRISYGTGKKGIFLEAGIHAREWISPATATYIANQLLTSDNKDIRLIAENFDWYIVPHTNPDGFVYTHTTDRLWRKTRKPYGNECVGVDGNRNWGFHWNEIGASDDPCSNNFAGPTPFSEIETRSLADYIAKLKDKIFMYISFHSFSQLLMSPYGYTNELPANYKDLKRVLDAGLEGVQRRYGTKYRGGNTYDVIYPAAGTSTDWAYGDQDIKYVYCFELRPSEIDGWCGHELPANEIIPTGQETLDSIVEMIKEAGITSFL